MDQTENQSPNVNELVAEALASAKKTAELREAAIAHILAQRDRRRQEYKAECEKMESDLRILGYVETANAQNGHKTQQGSSKGSHNHKRFKGVALAEVVRTLLEEKVGILHGKEIETLAKADGFTGGTQNFQNYLPVALKRAGGFENVGGNRWRLNEAIAPQRQQQ